MINKFIDYYDKKIKEMWTVTAGGKIRSLKGNLVETLAERMIRQAWQNIGGGEKRIYMDRRRYYITDNAGHRYGISQDKQVYIDKKFVLSIECKAYAEVAMYKRILVDSYLLKTKFPELIFCLLQLESMLGGDFATVPNHPNGSDSVHVLNSHFPDLNIEVITLLDGERNIKKEIHKRQFYKTMTPARVKYALDYFEMALRNYL